MNIPYLGKIKMTRKRILVVGLILAFFIMPGLLPQTGLYTIGNDVTATMTLYDNSGADGPYDGLWELVSTGTRVYTVLHAVVTPSATTYLAGFTLQLLTLDKSEILQSVVMTPSGGNYVADINVAGYATGNYWIRAKGIPTTHVISYVIENPDYTAAQIYLRENDVASLEELVKAGAYGGRWPIPETLSVTEVKNDVDVYNPPDREIFVENPWQDVQFDFVLSQASPDGPVTFSFAVTLGVITGVSLAVYDIANARIAASTDPNTFVFNTNQGQADGVYTAKVFVAGARGWIGGNAEIPFTVDNPDPISGIVKVYIFENNGWTEILDGGTLKGDVLVEVQILTGQPVQCVAIMDGPMGQTVYDMSWDGVFWWVIMDSRSLVNGLYSMDVQATRAEDGATAYLSVFQMDVTGGSGGMLMLFMLVAFLAVAFLLVRRMGGLQSTIGNVKRRL